MNQTKMWVLGICLVCVLVMLLGCGGPKFNTLKDADCFVERQRVEKQNRKLEAFVRDKLPIRRPSSIKDPLGKALVGANIVAGNIGTATMSVAGGMMKPTLSVSGHELQITGTVSFGRYATVFRQEQDKPLINIGAKAIEMAGDKPTSSCCDFVAVKLIPNSVLSSEYKDENNHIIISKIVNVIVAFNVKKEWTNPLSEDDWRPFWDYTERVSYNIKNIMAEEFTHPSPYCPEMDGV